MIDRRTLLALAVAAPFIAGAAPATRTIGKKAARGEFLKILALFDTADVPGFLAYGPPLLIDHDKLVARDSLPAFFESLNNLNGKPDEKPAWLDRGGFSHKNRPAPRSIFGAAVSRSVWMEAWDDDSAEDQNMAPIHMHFDAGYYPRFEQWNIFFEGSSIVRLKRWMEMS
jgi:hypothetical protein